MGFLRMLKDQHRGKLPAGLPHQNNVFMTVSDAISNKKKRLINASLGTFFLHASEPSATAPHLYSTNTPKTKHRFCNG